MLAVTENATRAIQAATRANDLLPDSGLRIAAEPPETDGGKPQLRVSIQKSPEASDHVVEAEGARVFLDAGAAEELSGKTLDAEVDESGGIRFLVSEAT